MEASRETGCLSASEPFTDGFLGDAVGGGSLTEREIMGPQFSDHFGSHQRGQRGISVHVVRVGWRWV